MSNVAPGVYIDEVVSPSYTETSPTTTQSMFIGGHNRGPTVPTLCQSWGQFTSLYGGFSLSTVPSNFLLGAYDYFSAGGASAYFLRVVHSDAVTAASPIPDAAAATTLTADAINPGAWGNGLWVGITAGPDATHFDLTVYYGSGSTAPTARNVVERWTDLSMSTGDSRYALSIVNNIYNGSAFITLTDAGLGLLPADTTTPIELGAGAGSTVGADGTVVTSADLAATQAQIDTIDTPLVINFPGCYDATNVLTPIINYVTNTRTNANAMVLVDTQQGQTPTAIISGYATSLPQSSYAAVYYPWLVVSDPASNVAGAVRTVPPCAFVMGQISKTDASSGPWVAPAGVSASLSVTAPERRLLDSDVGNLTAANVNPIIFQPGYGVVIWGASTLSNVIGTQYINVRRALIYIEASIKQISSFAPFNNNGPTLWTQLGLRISNFLKQLWASGGLAGATASQAFYVTCDSTNNTSTSNTTNVLVGVATQDPAVFIIIQVSQWNGGSIVSENLSGLAA